MLWKNEMSGSFSPKHFPSTKKLFFPQGEKLRKIMNEVEKRKAHE